MKTKRRTISRRGLLTTGAVVAAGSAALAGTSSLFGQGPAVITARRFRGWVTRGGGTNRTTLQELTLRPVSGRQLVVRTEATNLCYSNVGAVTGLQANAGAPGPGGGGGRAVIQGHGGVGIVEAVGPEVRRVRVGDRVCVSGTPQCGSCYQCLRGRADMCQFLMYQTDLFPVADMSDGTQVFANSLIGGLAELMVS